MLSFREQQIYELIHLNDKQISFELGIKATTVKGHKTNIFKKLGVFSVWEIINKQDIQLETTIQKRPNYKNPRQKQDKKLQNQSERL